MKTQNTLVSLSLVALINAAALPPHIVSRQLPGREAVKDAKAGAVAGAIVGGATAGPLGSALGGTVGG
jgi:hypothetical protein